MFTSQEARAFLCFRLKPTLERVSPSRDGMFIMASEYFALTFSCFGGIFCLSCHWNFSYIIATAHVNSHIRVLCEYLTLSFPTPLRIMLEYILSTRCRRF